VNFPLRRKRLQIASMAIPEIRNSQSEILPLSDG